MSGMLIRNFTSATSVHYHGGLPYDADGALLVSQGYCIGQNYTGWSRVSENTAADTSYTTIASVTMPAGTMGANSVLRIVPEWDYPASASRKLMAVDFGGTNISVIDIDGATLPTYRMGKILLEVQNLNSLTTQKTMNGSSYGVSANARLSSSINTANAVVIDFKVKWNAAASAETITLLGYSIWHQPGS